MNQKVIGQSIRNMREKLGLSQEEVEKAMGLDQKAMTRIETGQRSISSLERTDLAALFHCSIGDFFPEEKSNEDDSLITVQICCECAH